METTNFKVIVEVAGRVNFVHYSDPDSHADLQESSICVALYK